MKVKSLLVFCLAFVSIVAMEEPRKIFDISKSAYATKKRKIEPRDVFFERRMQLEVPKELKGTVEIPAEIFSEIILQMIPSARVLNAFDKISAADLLVESLQKIMESLELGNFRAGRALRRELINRIQTKGYNAEILTQAIRVAADKNQLFIAQILAESGAILPYEMIYDSIRLRSEWGIKKLLALIQTLPAGLVDFNDMPYFDKDLGVQINNPLEYLIMLLDNARVNDDRSAGQYLANMMGFVMQWATRNNYLHSMIHIDTSGQLLSDSLTEWQEWLSNPGFRRLLLNMIANYDPILAKKLETLFPLPGGVTYYGGII